MKRAFLYSWFDFSFPFFFHSSVSSNYKFYFFVYHRFIISSSSFVEFNFFPALPRWRECVRKRLACVIFDTHSTTANGLNASMEFRFWLLVFSFSSPDHCTIILRYTLLYRSMQFIYFAFFDNFFLSLLLWSIVCFCCRCKRVKETSTTNEVLTMPHTQLN